MSEGIPALPPINLTSKEQLDESFDLPALPELSARLMAQIRSGEATAKSVAEDLRHDPGLVLKILAIVNSAYYGLPRKISALPHAVAYLGLSEVNRVLMMASVMDTLKPDLVDDFRSFWEQSFHSTLAAKLLAPRYEPTLDPDDLYLAGLLHDVGELVYMRLFPDHWSALASYREQHDVTLPDAERALGLPSHQILGAAVAERWELPPMVAVVCEHHEDENFDGATDHPVHLGALRIVASADRLTRLARSELSPEVGERVCQTVCTTLGCEESDAMLMLAEVRELGEEVRRFLAEL